MFTQSYLKQLKSKGLIRGYSLIKSKPTIKNYSGIDKITTVLTKLNIPHETEYKFCKSRKFRFDVALLSFRLYIEYEGIASDKSRHTTMGGYTKDCTKYNIAALEGWKGLRYTAMNVKDFERDIVAFMCRYRAG